MTKRAGRWRLTAVIAASALALAGCENMDAITLFKGGSGGAGKESTVTPKPVRLVQRDVEAPDVFHKAEQGLWDGRPSLGGVWVAHADVTDPERVIIRNTENDKFVIGALFRRERQSPGPAFQVSSDAAEALGMLAGDPARLDVTALRREAKPQPEAAAPDTVTEPKKDTAKGGNAAGKIDATSLEPITGAAAAAIDKAEANGKTAKETKPQARPSAQKVAKKKAAKKKAPKKKAVAPASTLDKPFVQIGIFSVEKNAQNTATAMGQAGIVPTVIKQKSAGKTFWRVVVGPARDAEERAILLKKARDIGFKDAYAVTN